MTGTRQSHYVQARYLDGFLAPHNNQLWCYGRRRAKPYSAIPDKLARQRDFYRFPYSTSEGNLESYLEKHVETPGLAALRKLVETKRPLDVTDRIYLAQYIAFQEMRVPHTREINRAIMSKSIHQMLERFQSSDTDRAVVQNIALAEGVVVKNGERTPIFRENIEAYAREINDNQESFDIQMMVDLAKDVTTFFASMRWTILLARQNTAFITSDCPVFKQYKVPGGDDALLRPDCSVCCPLSSEAFLVMDHDIDYLELSSQEVQKGDGKTLPSTLFKTITDVGVMNFNQRIVEQSYRWCFSGNKMNWIIEAMQQPCKRSVPKFVSHGQISGVRHIRQD